tara:strand:+ start:552 stop:734 length:183 start_codon:yes stop_codon:yes gene_type:complete
MEYDIFTSGADDVRKISFILKQIMAIVQKLMFVKDSMRFASAGKSTYSLRNYYNIIFGAL